MKGIEIKGVTKRFGSFPALLDVNAVLSPNRITGLFGRNGAGKTTLLNIITNRSFASAGEVLTEGSPTAENPVALEKFYFISEQMLYPEAARIRHIFKWTKEMYPNFDETSAVEMLARFHLDPKSKIKALSTGYRTVVKLIIALNVRTDYVFFDEPVLGLDAAHRDLFYKLLIETSTHFPAGYLVSTHLIDEVANLVEDVIILDGGRVILADTAESIRDRYVCVSGPSEAVLQAVGDRPVLGTEMLGGFRQVYLEGPFTAPSSEITVTHPELQRLFIELTRDDQHTGIREERKVS